MEAFKSIFRLEKKNEGNILKRLSKNNLHMFNHYYWLVWG